MNSKAQNAACALCTMNDNGIRCLTSGKREEASQIFQQTLREIRRQMTTNLTAPRDVLTVFQPIATEACSNIKVQDRLTFDASFEIHDVAFSIKFIGDQANLGFGAAAMLYNMVVPQ